MELTRDGLRDREKWDKLGISLPRYDIGQVAERTLEQPTWVHFGAGNIFRGFISELQQRLLNLRSSKTGIVAVESFDYEIIDKIYRPYDNLSLLVLMHPDGTLQKTVVGSIAAGIRADSSSEEEWSRLKNIFRSPSLQMVSFTITEKGYSLKDVHGTYLPVVKSDLENGPARPKHVMAIVASLAYERYCAGQLPVAFVSMDNCSHNGEKLFRSVLEIVNAWKEKGLVPEEFASYLQNEKKVAFPWTMIDKITPRPSETVRKSLEKDGIRRLAPVITEKRTFIAPFVNAEVPQYLVVEDTFPNGRPPLEKAGVYFTDRETVNKTERMKVTTCLNPLHTALAIYGCLLGFSSISSEMQDPQLKKLVEKIGYDEGMPVVITPGILNPDDFIHEVIDKRLPNRFIPDTPQRIATDTSQKIAIRFGETIKSYRDRPDLDPAGLVFIPLALAGWLRYLLGVDDEGKAMEISADPMLSTLQQSLGKIRLGDKGPFHSALQPILANPVLFGVNLYEVGLGNKVEGYFAELVAGPHVVRSTLEKYLAD